MIAAVAGLRRSMGSIVFGLLEAELKLCDPLRESGDGGLGLQASDGRARIMLRQLRIRTGWLLRRSMVSMLIHKGLHARTLRTRRITGAENYPLGDVSIYVQIREKLEQLGAVIMLKL
jgi:hypothetical protein